MLARSAQVIHEALVRRYRDGRATHPGLRPAGSGRGLVVAVPTRADAPTPEAVAEHLRGCDGIRDVRARGVLLHIDVTAALAWEAVEARLARPAARLRQDGAPAVTPSRHDAAPPAPPEAADGPGADRAVHLGAPPGDVVAAQLAHARCARALRTARRVGVPEPSRGTVTRQPPPTPAPAAQATTPHPRTTLRTACRGRDCDTDSSSDHDTQFSASWGEALIDGEATAAALATVIADQPRVLGGGVPDPGGRPTPRALAEHLRALTRATDSWLDREPTRPRADQLPTDAHTAACRLTLGARIALADVLHTLGEAAPDRM